MKRRVFCPICGLELLPDIYEDEEDWNKDEANGEWWCEECDSYFTIKVSHMRGKKMVWKQQEEST